MEAVNLFSAENLKGRIDVARTVGSTATVMFIYDLGPGQSSSPYHYEYLEEWLVVVEGTLVIRTPTARRRSNAATSSAFPLARPERTRS